MKAISRNLYLLLLLLLLTAAPTAWAQEKGEISVFGGFSYLNDVFSEKHGWNASIAGNVMRYLALVGDFSGYYDSRTYLQNRYKYRDYSFLFGPRYVHTIGKRWTPFAHVLLGQYRETQDAIGSLNYDGPVNKNWFALDLGGGVDIRVSNRISVRALQLDIVRISNGDSHDHYGRVSFGAVFRLRGGSK